MKLLIFKTNIESYERIAMVNTILAGSPQVQSWSVDTEDIDNVLRIEADNEATESLFAELIEATGLECEALPD